MLTASTKSKSFPSYYSAPCADFFLFGQIKASPRGISTILCPIPIRSVVVGCPPKPKVLPNSRHRNAERRYTSFRMIKALAALAPLFLSLPLRR